MKPNSSIIIIIIIIMYKAAFSVRVRRCRNTPESAGGVAVPVTDRGGSVFSFPWWNGNQEVKSNWAPAPQRGCVHLERRLAETSRPGGGTSCSRDEMPVTKHHSTVQHSCFQFLILGALPALLHPTGTGL